MRAFNSGGREHRLKLCRSRRAAAAFAEVKMSYGLPVRVSDERADTDEFGDKNAESADFQCR